MLNNIKNSFTIQDLEILSGVKAHNIRIWEKRYSLLNPDRLTRNIRTYTLSDLQKMLNVSLLHKHGYKISKLAKLTDLQLSEEIKIIALDEISNNYQINSLIISMYTFDEALFEEIYLQQIEKLSFQSIFVHTYLPLLNHIGVLWQTDAIKPAHEHFISSLIYQKIVLNTALIKAPYSSGKHVYVLFLPEGEIHEMGLLFFNYYLKLQGNKTIYLGRDIPIDNLFNINAQFKEITWVSYFLIDKSLEDKNNFVSEFEKLLKHTKNNCLIFGRIWKAFSDQNVNEQIIFHEGFNDFISITDATQQK